MRRSSRERAVSGAGHWPGTQRWRTPLHGESIGPASRGKACVQLEQAGLVRFREDRMVLEAGGKAALSIPTGMARIGLREETVGDLPRPIAARTHVWLMRAVLHGWRGEVFWRGTRCVSAIGGTYNVDTSAESSGTCAQGGCCVRELIDGTRRPAEQGIGQESAGCIAYHDRKSEAARACCNTGDLRDRRPVALSLGSE